MPIMLPASLQAMKGSASAWGCPLAQSCSQGFPLAPVGTRPGKCETSEDVLSREVIRVRMITLDKLGDFANRCQAGDK